MAPGATYYLMTAAWIVASLGIIAATFPLLRRITGPEAASSEGACYLRKCSGQAAL